MMELITGEVPLVRRLMELRGEVVRAADDSHTLAAGNTAISLGGYPHASSHHALARSLDSLAGWVVALIQFEVELPDVAEAVREAFPGASSRAHGPYDLRHWAGRLAELVEGEECRPLVRVLAAAVTGA